MVKWTVGVVAMIDALGWKGIWQHEDASKVLDKLEQLELRFQNDAIRYRAILDSHFGKYGKSGLIRPKVVFLSDTVIYTVKLDLSAIPVGKHEESIGNIIDLSTTIINGFTKFAAIGSPLIYRGAISYGEYLDRGNFIIGPAVDDAAEWMNKPDAAVVILTPNASAMRNSVINKGRLWCPVPRNMPRFIKQMVPCKGNQVCDLDVVNVWATPSPSIAATRQMYVDQLVQAFERTPTEEVVKKFENTRRIIDTSYKESVRKKRNKNKNKNKNKG